MPPPVLPLLLPVPSPRTQPRVPSLGRQGLQAGASLGVCNGGWGYGPLGSWENRASGPDSPCRTGRSQRVSAPFSSGEESTRDCEAGVSRHQLPPQRCLNQRAQMPPTALVQGDLGGGGAVPAVPWARLCRDTRGLCGGERDLDCSQVTLGSQRARWAAPGSPTGGWHPPCSVVCAWHWGGTVLYRAATLCPPAWRTAPANPTLCPCQTCKILCSSLLRLEAGEPSTTVCSMVSMACKVCKEDKGWWQSFGGPSHPQEKDLNSPCKGRRPTLPGGARERPHARQAAVGSAACGTGCGQAHGKGAKNEGGKAKPRACPALHVRASLGTGRPGGPRGAQSSSPSAYLVVEGSVQALHVLFWRKAEDTAEAGV